MMLYPSVYTLVKGERKCRYSLVLAVAKKAREIAEDAERDGIALSERPVSLAVEMLENGEVDFIEPKPTALAPVVGTSSVPFVSGADLGGQIEE